MKEEQINKNAIEVLKLWSKFIDSVPLDGSYLSSPNLDFKTFNKACSETYKVLRQTRARGDKS